MFKSSFWLLFGLALSRLKPPAPPPQKKGPGGEGDVRSDGEKRRGEERSWFGWLGYGVTKPGFS